MTAIQSLYDCGAILAEKFDSIEDWERRLGTVTGGPGYCKSPIGGRGMTGGSGAVLDFSKKNKINYTAKSVVFWLTPAAYTGNVRHIYNNGYHIGTFGDKIQCASGSNDIYISIKNSGGSEAFPSAISYSPGQLIMISYSWDGSNIATYKNGVVDDPTTAFSGTLSCAGAKQIGSASSVLASTDKLHAIAIFDRALTATEHADLAKGQPFDRGPRSLVSEWRPGAGPTIPDTGWKNLGNNGTATDVTAVQTPYGAGGSFNGSTSNIETPLDGSSYTNYSLEIIFKPFALTDFTRLLTINNKASVGLRLNKLAFAPNNNISSILSSSTLAVGTQYHVIVTSDGKIFMNGCDDTGGANVGFAFSTKTMIGCRYIGGVASFCSGDIALAAVYNEALTPLQVRKRFNDVMARRF